MNFADELRRKEQEIQAKEARITALEKQLLPPNENNAELKIDLKNAQLSLSKLEADYKAFRSELLQVQRTQQTPSIACLM